MTVVFIYTCLETSPELKSANFFDLYIWDILEVFFGDIVLCQSHPFIRLPNWNIDFLLIVILKMVQPNHRVSIRLVFTCSMEFEYDW
jgi:hypothetical protein